jgi:hypothetical protein
MSGLPEREEERAGSRSLGPIAFGVAVGLLSIRRRSIPRLPRTAPSDGCILADHPWFARRSQRHRDRGVTARDSL